MFNTSTSGARRKTIHATPANDPIIGREFMLQPADFSGEYRKTFSLNCSNRRISVNLFSRYSSLKQRTA
jgi:hypothetical protein